MTKRLILGGLAILLLEAVSGAGAGAQTPSPPGNSQTPRGTGNYINYPAGTQIYQNGAIQTPDGSVTYPHVAVPRGDGSTTYYYQDGTRITTKREAFNNSGTYLTPGTVNGGLRNNSKPNPSGTFFIPGGLGRLPRNQLDRRVGGRCQLPGVRC